MSKYLFDCKNCMNKSVALNGNIYCKPMTEGKEAVYIKSGDRGKNYVFSCDYYTTENKQMTLHFY